MRLILKHPLMAVTIAGIALLWVAREASRGEHQHGFIATISHQDDPIIGFTGRPLSRRARRELAFTAPSSEPLPLSEDEILQSYFDEG